MDSNYAGILPLIYYPDVKNKGRGRVQINKPKTDLSRKQFVGKFLTITWFVGMRNTIFVYTKETS